MAEKLILNNEINLRSIGCECFQLVEIRMLVTPCEDYLCLHKLYFIAYFLAQQTQTDRHFILQAGLGGSASYSSGACGHFVGNFEVIFRPISRTEDGERRVEVNKGVLRWDERKWRIENSTLKVEGCGLRMDSQNLRISSFYNNI